jgi:hypothetical protein
VTTSPIRGRVNLRRGRRDYLDIGPLEPDHIHYLNSIALDTRRRTALTAWYGMHGGHVAWQEYQRILREAQSEAQSEAQRESQHDTVSSST